MNTSRPLSRRQFLSRGARGATALGLGLLGASAPLPIAHAAGADEFGDLLPPDSNGLSLPPGFTSRIVAVTGNRVAGTNHYWHLAPDGGATFETPDGGWVYVSNSEVVGDEGGVGAIAFARDGTIRDAYTILSGTSRNCAGGPTPWGTWLSCEETNTGRVFECDPLTPGSQGSVRPALGVFAHEAAAVDPLRQHVYMTEDQPNGLLYRFSASNYPSLAAGTLEAAEILDPDGRGPIVPGETRPLAWHVVPDPSATTTATLDQVPNATSFRGGEGCWFDAGTLFFSSKGDSRVWRIDTSSDQIEILYDFATAPSNALHDVDNVFAASTGDVYVAEDPGDLQIVALTPSGQVRPIVQVMGQSHTEITGPALSPDGHRLYFSSQRNPGTTYEVSGPFTSGSISLPTVGSLEPLFLGTGMSIAGALGARNYPA